MINPMISNILPKAAQNSVSPYHFTAITLMIAYKTMTIAITAPVGTASLQKWITTLQAVISKGTRIASKMKKFQPACQQQSAN